MKLRKQVVFLSLLAVLAYTDGLGALNISSSGNEFGGDVKNLESSPTLKEPSGIFYLDKSGNSSLNNFDVSTGENYHEPRQLMAESAKRQSAVSSRVGVEENPIVQVTDGVHETNGGSNFSLKFEQIGKEKLRIAEYTFIPSNRSMEVKHEKQSARLSAKVGPIKAKTEKQNDQTIIRDARVRYLKDQLIRGKVYLSLTATKNKAQFIKELQIRMKEVQRALGDATQDSELPKSAYAKLKAMDQTLAKGKLIQDDCAAMVKKLRAMVYLGGEQILAHKRQTLFLTHLATNMVSKGLHCLPLRLSSEYFKLKSTERHFSNQEKLEDLRLYHYALFSDNILAAAVVVNSTVYNAKDSSKHVFHIVTDRLNYAAMRMWFLVNPPRNATIQVQNIEEFAWLNTNYSAFLRQLSSPSMTDRYFRTRHPDFNTKFKFQNPRYLSILNHLRFYLPEIFPKLNKLLFLDDDIVVQKDLTALWSFDMKGRVNGAVETCQESFGQLYHYLNFSNPVISRNFDPHACGWAFGMNIFDLEERRQNITEVHHSWYNLNHNRQLWKLGTLPLGLLTFWNRTFLLDPSWQVLGLGYNSNVSLKDIEQAAVIHYNGNLKPWLDIGIPKYQRYWSKFLDYDGLYMQECNINP